MSIVVPNQAERNILKLILDTNFGSGSIPAGDLYINIMASNITLTENTTLENLKTGELTVDKYPESSASRIVSNTEWSLVGSDGIATASEKVLVLRNGTTEPYLIHGYFITKGVTVDDVNNVLMWAEKFPTPFSIPVGGSTLKLALRLELD